MTYKEEDWNRLLDASLQKQVLCLHLREIVEHLFKLTLRHPSEDVLAMLTVLLLFHDQGRFMDGPSLRSSYLSAKTQFKTYMDALKKSDTNELPLLGSLPADPKTLPEEYRRQAFGEEGRPAALPACVKYDQFVCLAQLVPQRGNHGSLKLYTQPSMLPMGKGGFNPQFQRQQGQYLQAAAAGGLCQYTFFQTDNLCIFSSLYLFCWFSNDTESPWAGQHAQWAGQNMLQPQGFLALQWNQHPGQQPQESVQLQPLQQPGALPSASSKQGHPEDKPSPSKPLLALPAPVVEQPKVAKPVEKDKEDEKVRPKDTEPKAEKAVEKDQETDLVPAEDTVEPPKVEKEAEAKKATDEKQLKASAIDKKPNMSVKDSMSRLTDAMNQRGGALKKRPAAALEAAPKPKAAAKSAGKTMKKPAAAPKEMATKKKQDPETAKIPKGNGRQIPKKEKRVEMVPEGCTSCRRVAGCTPSCWVKKGWVRRNDDK